MTAHQHSPDEKGWAVLVSRVRRWRETAQMSVLLFAVVIGAGAIVLALMAGGFGWRTAEVGRRGGEEPTVLNAEEPAEPVARRLLDGKPLDTEASGDYVAVLIDNMTPARPASGLSAAMLVIEAPAESVITRFLAFYDLADTEAVAPERIGPVRSVRPYFIDWAAEVDAMLVHVGGSPEAIDRLRGSTLRDLNEFSAGAYFWRDRVRPAPHNTYTSLDELRRAVANRYEGRAPRPVFSWKFTDILPVRTDDVDSLASAVSDVPRPGLSVSYGAPAYDVVWMYDPKTDEYVRRQGGAVQRDGATEIRAKNVVVQVATMHVLDAEGRRRVGTLAGGLAWVARGGEIVPGTWAFTDGRTRFYDSVGSEIVMLAGTTWIQVIGDADAVSHE